MYSNLLCQDIYHSAKYHCRRAVCVSTEIPLEMKVIMESYWIGGSDDHISWSRFIIFKRMELICYTQLYWGFVMCIFILFLWVYFVTLYWHAMNKVFIPHNTQFMHIRYQSISILTLTPRTPDETCRIHCIPMNNRFMTWTVCLHNWVVI